MTTHNSRHGLLLEQRGEVTVVRLTMSEVMLVEVIESVGDELFALVEDEGRRHLLLDFQDVRQISSALLGKLIALHKRLLALKGQMAVCGIHPELYKLFALCQLPRLLHIYPTVDDALQGLWRAGAP